MSPHTRVWGYLPEARWFFAGGTAFFTAIFVFLTINTLREITACQNQDRMTESVVRRKHIFDRNSCMGYHKIMDAGAYHAPELTKVVERRSAQWITLFLEDPEAMLPGRRRMIKNDFSGQDIQDVIAFFGWIGEIDTNGFPPGTRSRTGRHPREHLARRHAENARILQQRLCGVPLRGRQRRCRRPCPRRRRLGRMLPRPYVTGETVETVVRDLSETILPGLLGQELADMDTAAEFLSTSLDGLARNQKAAFCAAELAVLDLLGKDLGQSAGAVLGPVLQPAVRYSGVIATTDPRTVQQHAAFMKQFGVSDVKVKVVESLDVRAPMTGCFWNP